MVDDINGIIVPYIDVPTALAYINKHCKPAIQIIDVISVPDSRILLLFKGSYPSLTKELSDIIHGIVGYEYES